MAPHQLPADRKSHHPFDSGFVVASWFMVHGIPTPTLEAITNAHQKLSLQNSFFPFKCNGRQIGPKNPPQGHARSSK
ncbi:Uncharacterized protein TCM_015871 [Theobroma cacao]|uniref:Uncharacterized protein n=1 Tax=Theobroma cacao TaxID=3641 RepID=A0A061G3T0_THECC|nr:Uncharacterized protein TCM_015871 [Theobroma cacao]